VRFEEFVEENHIEVVATDRFDGFAVGVALPPDWEPAEAVGGLRVWVWTTDPRRADFCANAVLNLYRVEAAVDPRTLFPAMCEQQCQSVQNHRELYRDLAAATEGPGAVGTLLLQIDHELGTIDSATRSRIVTVDRETLIAELTVTALRDSTPDLPQFGLSVVADDAAADGADAGVVTARAPGH
jgi:hypothetical protein